MSPLFKAQLKQNEIMSKYFRSNIVAADFVTQTLRVNKIALKKYLQSQSIKINFKL